MEELLRVNQLHRTSHCGESLCGSNRPASELGGGDEDPLRVAAERQRAGEGTNGFCFDPQTFFVPPYLNADRAIRRLKDYIDPIVPFFARYALSGDPNSIAEVLKDTGDDILKYVGIDFVDFLSFGSDLFNCAPRGAELRRP